MLASLGSVELDQNPDWASDARALRTEFCTSRRVVQSTEGSAVFDWFLFKYAGISRMFCYRFFKSSSSLSPIYVLFSLLRYWIAHCAAWVLLIAWRQQDKKK